MPGETVQPSPEPDAATATGTGGDKDAAAPTPPDESASTSGLGSASDQQSSGAPPANAPYDLSGGEKGETGDDQPAQSPSGV